MKGKDNRWDQSPEEETILKAVAFHFGEQICYSRPKKKKKWDMVPRLWNFMVL